MTHLTIRCFYIYSLHVPSSEKDNNFTPTELVNEKHIGFSVKKLSSMPSSTTERVLYNSTNFFGIDQRQFVTEERMSNGLSYRNITPDTSKSSWGLNHNMSPSNVDASLQHSTSSKN